MNLIYIYEEINRRLMQLDFSELWPGFRKYPYAVYTSKEICLNGELMPYDEAFFANTAIVYRGVYTAIWDIESDPDSDFDLLAANLVHEMFHCFQNESGESRWQDDLIMLCYPERKDNYSFKWAENQLLAQAVLALDKDEKMTALRKMTAIRMRREQLIGNILRQEYLAETIEGAAEFAGSMALQKIAPDKYQKRIARYAELLMAPSDLVCDIRRVSYYTGCLYLVCLKQLNIAFDHNMNNSKTIYEISSESIVPLESHPVIDDTVSAICQNCVQSKEQKLQSFWKSKPVRHEFQGFICGYDPMNMFRLENWIYCSHFAALGTGNHTNFFQEEIVLEMEEGSSNRLKAYYTKS